ncbi:MAG: hypothetical protein GY906_11710 [bacterium]|nr:hypothetical protein [bacterium]
MIPGFVVTPAIKSVFRIGAVVLPILFVAIIVWKVWALRGEWDKKDATIKQQAFAIEVRDDVIERKVKENNNLVTKIEEQNESIKTTVANAEASRLHAERYHFRALEAEAATEAIAAAQRVEFTAELEALTADLDACQTCDAAMQYIAGGGDG